MKNLLWLNDVNENIEKFLESLKSDDNKYNFRPSKNGLEESGEKLNLGFSCYALKIFFITGLWDKLDDQKKKEWADNINSFQKTQKKFPENSFIDDEYVKYFHLEQNKQILKNSVKKVLNFFPNFKYLTKNELLMNSIRAESKQAISTLYQVNTSNQKKYKDFPSDPETINLYLKSLNWSKPWSSGAQFASLCVFNKTQLDNHQASVKALKDFSNKLVNKDSGGYYFGNSPNSQEFINGTMKMITGFDWLDSQIHYPEKLIDYCLDTNPSSEGCDLVDIVYVLYMCQKQTNYRKSEIVKYLKDLISIIYLHFFPNLYGFSYFLNKSQTHYYGVKISKGLNTPDIHGTTLLVWALSMILEIIEFETFKWNPLKP